MAGIFFLTDIARIKNPDESKAVVANWMRLRSTIEFLDLWEQIHNPDFKGLEFDAFKKDSHNSEKKSGCLFLDSVKPLI